MRALGTVPLDATLTARLTGPPAGVLRFAGAGRAFAVPLPLAVAEGRASVAALAAALGAALPDCFVCAADGRLVVVPAPASSAPASPPRPSALACDLGLADVLALDPESGRFAWPAAWAPPSALAVDYGYAASSDLGGGSYPRPDDGAAGSAGTTVAALDDPAGDLDAALDAWSPAAPSTAIRLDGGATRTLAATRIAVAAGQSLRIAARSPAQACIRSTQPAVTLSGPASGAPAGRLILDGLTLAAGLAPAGGALDLTLTDLTLIPPAGRPAIAAASPSGPGILSLRIIRCRIGPIDLAGLDGDVRIADTVLSAMPEPAFGNAVLGLPAAMAAHLARTTLLGGMVAAGTLEASDTLFAGRLDGAGPARFDHCFVSDLRYPRPTAGNGNGDDGTAAASVTRCTACGKVRALRLRNCYLRRLFLDASGFCTCGAADDGTAEGPARDCAQCRDPACAETCPLRGPDRSWEPIGPARFDPDNRYPLSGFARLADDSPRLILAGASDRDVLGAGNRAAPTARSRAFEAALRETLLFGTGLAVTYES